MEKILLNFNATTILLLSLSIMLFAGFVITRFTKLARLPNVTGFILAGVIIGPYVFNVIPHDLVHKMNFVSDIALAFIAFGVGRYFKKSAFENSGLGIITITLFESLIPGIFITLLMRYGFGYDWDFSLLLGAIATATAPASTMATIRQYNAKGKFVNTLLQVVALDDAVCLIIFSVIMAVINARHSESLNLLSIMLPVVFNILAMGLGLVFGIILSRLLRPTTRSEDNRLILTVAMLLALAGICSAVDISPLLSCMVFGTVYINLTRDKGLYRQLEKFTPPIFSMFFVVSGMSLDLSSFKTLGIVGIAYFFVRIIGKYLGAWTGASLVKSEKEIRNYLGFALVPQAGVAIGLAFLGKRILPVEVGNMLLTIILSSSVLYELIGPASAKFAIFKSGSLPAAESVGEKKSP